MIDHHHLVTVHFLADVVVVLDPGTILHAASVFAAALVYLVTALPGAAGRVVRAAKAWMANRRRP
jgi:hypothetical protein